MEHTHGMRDNVPGRATALRPCDGIPIQEEDETMMALSDAMRVTTNLKGYLELEPTRA